MIRAVIYRSGDKVLGFESEGHAGAGEYGFDIVCSAVSALTINTVNAVENLTDAHFTEDQDPEGGYLKVMLSDGDDRDAQVLMKALEMGLSQIAENYPDNVRVKIREVRA